MINWTRLAQDLAQVVADNAVSITLRRGTTTLAAQTVRIARTGNGSVKEGAALSQESRGRVVIVGSTTLDIQPEDRFTVADGLYRVVWVRPNRRAAVIAEAELVQ